MVNEKIVFCFEGINNRIWKAPEILTQETFESLKEYCYIASDVLGTDFYKELCLGKSEDLFRNSYIELVVTYICNYVVFYEYEKNGIRPDILIGFSLGLNTAAVCSGMLTFEGGLEILRADRNCMQYLSGKKDYSMALIAGLPKDLVMQIISRNNLEGRLKIAGEVSEYCTLVTGETEGISKIETDCQAEGAMRFNRINSYIPFHFGLHDETLDREIERINRLKVSEGKYPVFSVYSLETMKGKSDVTEELKKNIYTPMQWKKAIELLEEKEFHQFWDISITASNKKITSLTHRDSVFHTYKQFKKLIK